MSPGPIRLGSAGMLAAALLCQLWSVPAAAQEGGGGGSEPEGRVLMVSMPRLTWERLAAVDTPVIDEFLAASAMASVSTRTVGSRTSPGNAYLTLGAGSRTTASGTDDAGAVMMGSESTDAGAAADVYARRSGVLPTGRLLGLNFAQLVRRNEVLLYGSRPGSMGEALRGAGLLAGAIANADETFDSPPQRQAALTVLDGDGQAPLGEVGSSLLVADAAAAGGVRTDPDVVMNAAQRALDDRASLLLVEMSDMERAELARPAATVEVGDDLYDRALRSADALFGQLLEAMDPAVDLVILLSPTAPLEGEELTVYAMRGPGAEVGWARSATTRRDGYVSLSDVAATVLGFLGVELGEDMSDTPITTSGDGATWSDRVDASITANDRAVFRDDAVGPLTVSFIVLLLIMLILVAVAVALGRDWSPQLLYLVLLVMAVPAATYLGGLLPYGGFGVATYGLALVAIAAVIAGACMPLARRDDQAGPVLVAGATVLVLAIDILTGGHLQLDTIFGYSPIVAGRFAGFGNQAFSLISVSTLLVASGGWALWGRYRSSSTRLRLPIVLFMFAFVVVVVGMPTLGSDVGGVLASVPAFAVCTLLLTGRRVRLRTAALIAGATVAVLVLFAALDLSRPRRHVHTWGASPNGSSMAAVSSFSSAS